MVSLSQSAPTTRGALRKFFWVGLTSFGAGRWTYLHDTFVRAGWIDEATFLRDYALSEVLPGASFVNLVFLCGLRIGGLLMGIAGLLAVMLPGTVMIVGAIIFLTSSDLAPANALHGILVGAVAGLFAAYVRLARRELTTTDKAIVLATLAMSLAGVPLVLTVALALLLGLLVYRPRQAAPE